MNHRIPPALRDLIDELRKSKMLPVVGVLVVAIIAVPVLLGKSAPAEVAPPAPGVVGAEAAPPNLGVAVRRNEPGVRKYKQRTKGVERANPFEQRFSKPVGGSTGSPGTTGDAGPSPAAGGGGGTASSAPASNSPASTSIDPASSGSGAGAGPPVSEPSPPSEPSPTGPSEKPVSLEPRATVLFGLKGEKPTKRKIRLDQQLSHRPSVGSFVRVKGERAYFKASNKVDRIETEGNCKPSRQRCLKTGLGSKQKAKFIFVDEAGRGSVYDDATETVYVLKLLDLDFVELEIHTEAFGVVRRGALRSFPRVALLPDGPPLYNRR